jgi:hypothetical protein
MPSFGDGRRGLWVSSKAKSPQICSRSFWAGLVPWRGQQQSLAGAVLRGRRISPLAAAKRARPPRAAYRRTSRPRSPEPTWMRSRARMRVALAPIPASLAESQGAPGHRTLGRLAAWFPARWQRRRRDKGFNTHDLTVVHVMSHHSNTSASVAVSPNPPKPPRHLFEALQDGEDPSFRVYD